MTVYTIVSADSTTDAIPSTRAGAKKSCSLLQPWVSMQKRAFYNKHIDKTWIGTILWILDYKIEKTELNLADVWSDVKFSALTSFIMWSRPICICWDICCPFDSRQSKLSAKSDHGIPDCIRQTASNCILQTTSVSIQQLIRTPTHKKTSSAQCVHQLFLTSKFRSMRKWAIMNINETLWMCVNTGATRAQGQHYVFGLIGPTSALATHHQIGYEEY